MQNPKIVVHGMIAAFILVLFIASVEHILPYHVPPMPIPVVVPVPRKPPADCLPSGSGRRCMPFSEIEKLMEVQPDAPEVIPPNPAAANEQTT